MTNTQLYLAVGLPTVTALLGILATLVTLFALNFRIDRMENKVDGLGSKLDSKLDLIHRDIREFYATQRVHDEAIASLKQQRNP